MRFSARRDKNVRFSAILCKLILRILSKVVSLHNVIVGDSKKSTGTQPSCRGGYLLNYTLLGPSSRTCPGVRASLVHDLSAKTAYRRQFIVKKQEIITRNADLESINR